MESRIPLNQDVEVHPYVLLINHSLPVEVADAIYDPAVAAATVAVAAASLGEDILHAAAVVGLVAEVVSLALPLVMVLPVLDGDIDLDVSQRRILDVQDVVRVKDDELRASQLHSVVVAAVVVVAH